MGKTKYQELQPFYHVADARLSEGLTYIKETDTLLWVDIYRGEIHRLDSVSASGTANHKVFNVSQSTYSSGAAIKYPKTPTPLRESVGCIFPVITDGQVDTVLFGSKFGVGRCQFSSGEWEYLTLYSRCPELASGDRWLDLRSNDGNVSPDGKSLYVGVMCDFHVPMQDIGAIVRVDLVGSAALPLPVHLVIDRVKIPNAIHWNSAGTKMYWTDSLHFCLWEQDGDDSSTKKKLIDVQRHNPEFESPEPDGSATDLVNNVVYVCVWSTHKVQKYSLEDGTLLHEYVLPQSTPRISSCCFVGRDLCITTANLDIEQGSSASGDSVGGCIYKLTDVLDSSTDVGSAKRQPDISQLP